MGFLDWALGRETTLDVASAGPAFEAVSVENVPPELFGLSSFEVNPVAVVGRIKRDSVRQIPAVKRARDIICGTLGMVPIQVVDRDNVVSFNGLLDQPEANVPRSVTMTRLFEDLLYDGIAWWRVVGNDYRGRPNNVLRVDPALVEVRDGKVYLNGRLTAPGSLIRFDSPNDPLLFAGARAFRTLLRLEATAANQAQDPVPQGYFRPADDSSDPDADTVVEILSAWKLARQQSATGYVPSNLEYQMLSFSPKEQQLVEARQHAVLEVARLTGISADDLSVEVSSKTYANAQDSRRQRINDVLGPYVTAVTDRLRMPDITPQGYEVRADFSSFLKADDKTRLENYKLAVDLGLYTVEQVAEFEGLPAPTEPPPAPPAPTVTATQVPVPQKEIAS